MKFNFDTDFNFDYQYNDDLYNIEEKEDEKTMDNIP